MAATGGAELQRADGAETAGAAAGATDGAAQAAALSDLSHAGKTGPPRAPHAAAAGSQLEPVFQLAVRPSRAAFARALLKPGVENHFRLVPPHDGDPSRPCCLENGPSLAARPLPAPWPTLLPARSPVRLLPPPSTVASHLLRTDYGPMSGRGPPLIWVTILSSFPPNLCLLVKFAVKLIRSGMPSGRAEFPIRSKSLSRSPTFSFSSAWTSRKLPRS